MILREDEEVGTQICAKRFSGKNRIKAICSRAQAMINPVEKVFISISATAKSMAKGMLHLPLFFYRKFDF